MARRLPAGSSINIRLEGACCGCGQHVKLFNGYVLPGIRAPRLCCVPCSVSPAGADPALKPALPKAAE